MDSLHFKWSREELVQILEGYPSLFIGLKINQTISQHVYAILFSKWAKFKTKFRPK